MLSSALERAKNSRMDASRASIDTGNAAGVLMSLANRISEPGTSPPPLPDRSSTRPDAAEDDEFHGDDDESIGNVSSVSNITQEEGGWWRDAGIPSNSAINKQTAFDIFISGKLTY